MHLETRKLSALSSGHSAFTLVEILVSLALTSTIVAGALAMLMHGRGAYQSAQVTAELEDTGRVALAAIELEITSAGFLGLTAARGGTGSGTNPPGAATLTVANDCGMRWAVDILTPIEGHNNRYGLDCRPYLGRASDGADTLVVRRAALEKATIGESGRLYVLTRRGGGAQILLGSGLPELPTDEHSELRELVTRAFYVSETSSLSTPGNTVPSLRMKTLVGGGRGPRIADQEVLPGVEDLQVEFGVDLDPIDAASSGTIDLYVPPESGVLDPEDASFAADARILAVRVWLRLRSELPDHRSRTQVSYQYSDREFAATSDTYRRDLVSTTLYVYNASTM